MLKAWLQSVDELKADNRALQNDVADFKEKQKASISEAQRLSQQIETANRNYDNLVADHVSMLEQVEELEHEAVTASSGEGVDDGESEHPSKHDDEEAEQDGNNGDHELLENMRKFPRTVVAQLKDFERCVEKTESLDTLDDTGDLGGL
jgi:seryl-tRNA synthetase